MPIRHAGFFFDFSSPLPFYGNIIKQEIVFVYSTGAIMRKKQKNPFQKTVSGVLSHVVKDRGWEQKLDAHSVFLNWGKLVGDEVATCCQPHKIVNNVLWVEVENSSWMQQLQFEKIALLERLNSSLRLSRIGDIKFILPEKAKKVGKKAESKIRFKAPDPEELKEFEQQASLVEDEKSREALVRLWYLSKACIKE